MSTARFYDKQSLCRAIVLDYQPDHEEGEDPGQWKKRREQRFIPTFLRIMGKERAGSLDQAKSIEELGKQPSYVKFLWLMQARKRLSEEAFLRQLSRISGKSFGRMPSEEELRKIGERFFRGWVDDTCRNLRVRAEENGPGTGYGDDVRLVKEFEAYLRRMESAEEAEEETGEDDEVIGEEDLSESGAALFAGRRTYTGAYRNGGSGERNGEDYIESCERLFDTIRQDSNSVQTLLPVCIDEKSGIGVWLMGNQYITSKKGTPSVKACLITPSEGGAYDEEESEEGIFEMKYLVDPYDNVREAILQFREDVESNEEPLVYSDFYRDLNGELPKSLTGLPESLAIYYRETERICNDYGKREAAAIGKMKEQDDLRAGRREQP